jgi:hypothetical protein
MSNSLSQNKNTIIPWDAHIAPAESISLEDAKGRIASSTIRQYPPGIPDVIPGMQYTTDIIDNLTEAREGGVDLVGIKKASNPRVDVTSENDNKTKFEIRTFESQNIKDNLINEIADFFRLQFSVAPYYHFAFHESDPLQSLPQNLDYAAYAVSAGLYEESQRRTCQETLRDMAYRNTLGSKAPAKQETTSLPKGFHHWTDKKICRQQMKARFSDPGYVTLIRNKTNNRLEGLLHSRMGSIERLFNTEEWRNPHIFSDYTNSRFHARPDVFYEKMKYHFELNPADLVMTISAQILTPAVQGGDIFYDMMRAMAKRIRPEHTRLPLLCEIPSFGTAHTLNRAFTDRIIFGALRNTHPLVFCKQTSQALFPFISDKHHWHSALRAAVKRNRDYRSKYYIPLSSDNESLEVRPNGELGLGVFAIDDIPIGSRIAVFTGERYQSDTALGLPALMRDHAIQVGETEYVFGYKGLAHRVCHSCDPNCGIRKLTEIFAVRHIAAGEQITWDYRCSENSNWVLDKCLCGTERCTGTVKNHDSLPKTVKAEYFAKGMVSDWITP